MIIIGDAKTELKGLEEKSVNCCVTSPPYFGLRDYGVDGQSGLESTPDEYVKNLVEVFREVSRVLKDDGTLWLNLGDSYAGNHGHKESSSEKQKSNKGSIKNDVRNPGPGLKQKDLIGIPWRVAFGLQADGWYLRNDIIWNKPNTMTESVKDRCTMSHEYFFLLSKSRMYYYDNEAIKEPCVTDPKEKYFERAKITGRGKQSASNARGKDRDKSGGFPIDGTKRNKRSVWTVPTKSYKGAHFATFPPDLIEPCILAGCPPEGLVLDPFFGSGTVGQVAKENRRDFIGIELNPEYKPLIDKRIESAHYQSSF